MLLMISSGFGIPEVARNFSDSGLWRFLAYETDHASWRGCTLWDLIQPSFMFMVGVSLPYSLAARRAKGDGFGKLFRHALWRSAALVILGIFLSTSARDGRTNFIFTIVLAQIGLGYPFLWLLAWTKPRTQLIAAGAILFCVWLAFALYPVAPSGFAFQDVGVAKDFPFLSGFEAHWQKSANITATVDRWFLNLFPRDKPFVFNAGGYQTLNFVSALATMIFGLFAGGILISEQTAGAKVKRMLVLGVGGLALGLLLDASGLCPMVKRIWTPTFAIFSGGWAFLLLALFYSVIEIKGYRRWAFAFVVAGMNSIALYCMSQLMRPWVRERLRLHLGKDCFEIFGATYAPMVEMWSFLIIFWLIALWMYRRKIFLRI